MFERFTDRARRVVVLAREEARTSNHNYIGTEHILFGLAKEGDGVATRVLRQSGVSAEAVHSHIRWLVGWGVSTPPEHPFSGRAHKTFELALRETYRLKTNYIGTEHILLGLIRTGEGNAHQILGMLKVEPTKVRRATESLLFDGFEERRK